MLCKYTPVNFSNIRKVELVGFDDPQYLQWKEWLGDKKQLTPSQIKRRKEIEKYPEEVEKLKSLYLNKTCFICKRLYEPNAYSFGKYRCWGNRVNCRYIDPNIKNANECRFFKFDSYDLKKYGIKNLTIYDSNIDYYLSDIGLIEKPKHHPIGVKAKQLERNFKDRLKEIDDIEIINKLFKIYTRDGRITFKIPDVIFKSNNHYGIIEYKADYGDVQQLKDYHKLFFLSMQQDSKMYWVVNDCWSIKEMKEKYEPEGISVLKETDFFTIEFPKYQRGLSVWM